MLSLAFGWVWITMGFMSGAVLGLGFHREKFLGGYNSWPRRMSRLGHIAFFGTGFLNVLFGLSELTLSGNAPDSLMWDLARGGLIVGAIAMPLCCFLCAACKRARHVFVLPVVALTLGGTLIGVELARLVLDANGGMS